MLFLVLLCFTLQQSNAGLGLFAWYSGAQLLFGFVVWLIALFAAIKNNGFWRLCFLLLLVPQWLVLVFDFRVSGPNELPYLSTGLKLLTGICLLIPVVKDVRKCATRDWLHWIGVSLGAIMFIGWQIFAIVWRLNQ